MQTQRQQILQRGIAVLIICVVTGCSRVQPVTESSLNPSLSCKSISILDKVHDSLLLPCLIGDQEIDLKAIKGPALVHVWGSWCEPCKKEIPLFVSLNTNRPKNLGIIGVDIEEPSAALARTFIRHFHMDWPQLYDSRSLSRSVFGVGVPTTLFINNRGVAIGKHVGPFNSSKELALEIKKYLNVNVVNQP